MGGGKNVHKLIGLLGEEEEVEEEEKETRDLYVCLMDRHRAFSLFVLSKNTL